MFGLICDDKFSISSQEISASKDIFNIPKMDKNKCPKIENQNTFHFLKSPIFSSYVGTVFLSIFQKKMKFPYIM